MKKRLSILLIVCLLSFLTAGCGSSELPAETTANIPQTTAAPAAEVVSPAETTVPETTAVPTEAGDPMLGKWIGIYLDMSGLKIPTGREQGMAIDLLLEENGKLTYICYLEEDGETTVAGDWSGDETAFQIHSDSKDMPGTFQCSITEGVLTIQNLLGEDTAFKMAKAGSEQETALREECRIFQEILDEMETETTAP